MDEQRSESSIQTRRGFLKSSAAAGLTATLKPSLALAQHPEKLAKQERHRSVNWDRLYELVDHLKVLEKDPKLKEIVDDVNLNIEKAEQNFDHRMDRLDQIEEATRADLGVDGRPRLIGYYQKLLGKMTQLKVNDVLPFTNERKFLHQRLYELEEYLQKTLDAKSGKPIAVPEPIAASIRRKKQAETSDLGILFGVRYTREERFYMGNIEAKYEYVRNHIAYTYMSVRREEGVEDKVGSGEGVTIEVRSNTKEVRMSDKNRKLFEEHKKRIEGFLENFSAFKKIYAKVQLFTRDYGFGPIFGGVGGWFDIHREYGERNYKTVVAVNMDSGKYIGEHRPEIIFAHEAFGHALDVEINDGLADRLSPQDYLERLAYQHEILNNPDWANKDETIQGLFDNYPISRSNQQFITQKQEINTAEFVGIINEYPRNIILTDGLGWNDSRILDRGLPVTPGHPIYGEGGWLSGGVGMHPDSILPPSLQKEFKKKLAGVPKFETLDKFLDVYLPALRKDAESGNIRSKILLWGIENFKQEFNNTKFVWSKPRNGTAREWGWYCSFILLNAITYHAFLNGVDEVRNLVPKQGWEAIEKRIYYLRQLYRAELFAEGAAYSYYFGSRLAEKTPYQGGLEHIASLIEKGSRPLSE